MMNENVGRIKRLFSETGFLRRAGAYGLVDGQYGSTGKGLAAALLAETSAETINWATTNAGPNSGHTSYYNDEKIVLKQLPTSPVIAAKMGLRIDTFINAGAILNLDRLGEEVGLYLHKKAFVYIHPHAAVVTPSTMESDQNTVSVIGSTGQGTGPALADKILRVKTGAVVRYHEPLSFPFSWYTGSPFEIMGKGTVGLVEVSQGYSLGVNSGFYPYCTSRECTIGQALSDAAIHPHLLRDTMMVVRTYPIRVAGESGPCYSDQEEISWDKLGVEPELTTVTKKVRRVFTWSEIQFREALKVNRPGYIFLNFCNYLAPSQVENFVTYRIISPYVREMGSMPHGVILGFGPYTEDCVLWQK